MKANGKYENTKSVKTRWPKLTLMELAEGQNKINGSILATTQRLEEALNLLSARLEALEKAGSTGATSSSPGVKETAALTKAIDDAALFIKGIGGKEPPGCQLPQGF